LANDAVINKCTTFEDPIASFIPNMGRTTKSLQIRVVLVWGCRGPDRLQTARGHMLRAVGHWVVYPHSHTIWVYGWWRGVVVTSLGASSKLLYAEPG